MPNDEKSIRARLLAHGIDLSRLPRHVAIIMDGNGRWAQGRGLERLSGHRRGKDSVKAIVQLSRDIGLEYLSLYAFSSENWERPASEVNGLMSLLKRYLTTELDRMMKNNVRLQMIGDPSRLPADVKRALSNCVETTKHNSGLTVILALSYSARAEIAVAVQKIAARVKRGEIAPESINEDTIAQSLGTAGIPDPDLLIRTSGEVRLSNFLLWQVAYTELLVLPVLWPDFSSRDLCLAVADYQRRTRRFGGV
jgi:undecaprenyl diphosphate synthase